MTRRVHRHSWEVIVKLLCSYYNPKLFIFHSGPTEPEPLFHTKYYFYIQDQLIKEIKFVDDIKYYEAVFKEVFEIGNNEGNQSPDFQLRERGEKAYSLKVKYFGEDWLE